MPAIVLDGKLLAKSIHDEVRNEVKLLTPQLGRAPKLAVILVGDNPASHVYVKSKTKTAHSLGIDTTDVVLPATVSHAELHVKIRELNGNKELDGILLQLPLPKGLDEFSAIKAISPALDVDGLHPTNQGLLMRGEDAPRPCTPRGIIALIEKARSELGQPEKLDGLRAVVLGRSILVGKPVSLMLLERQCTVTVCHSKTADLKGECRQADILVAAIGKPELVTKEYIKPGAIVIDVGINRLSSGQLVGDVDFNSAKDLASALTPVPGGVGPMTIAMLLKNTVEAAKKKVA